MFRIFGHSERKRAGGAFWLAGQFDRRAHPATESAIATWSELMGREAAVLWLDAKAHEGRGR
jgi:hypothetical protein